MEGTRSYHYTKFIFFIRYFADALFYCYPALYLASININEGMIGTVLSITTITSLLINPLWSFIVKNNKVNRILLFVLSIIEGILIIVYGNISSIETIMALTCLMAVVASPYYNLLDGYSAGLCAKYKKEYSRIRVMGSIAYLVALFLGGVLLDWLGFKILFFISGIIFILTGLLSIFMERYEINLENIEEKRNYKEIIKNKWFILYCIIYVCTASLMMTSDGFISLVFTKIKGVSEGTYSFIHGGAILVEVITIFALGKLKKKINLNKLFLIGVLILFFRPFILSFTNLPLPIMIIATCIRGIGWGTILFVSLKIIISLVGLSNTTTAVVILSIFQCLFQFIMSNVIGYAIEYMGYQIPLLIISIITILSGFIYFMILLKTNRLNFE